MCLKNNFLKKTKKNLRFEPKFVFGFGTCMCINIPIFELFKVIAQRKVDLESTLLQEEVGFWDLEQREKKKKN